MKNEEEIKELHCGPFWGRSSGGRPRLPVEAEIKAVNNRTTVFSLPHACLAAGLLGEGLKQLEVSDWHCLQELANEKWGQSMERFFSDLKSLGVTSETVVLKSIWTQGAIIGWSFPGEAPIRPRMGLLRICPDLDLTLAVLSKRVADIFISTRDPDFRWDNLFGSGFEIDEDVIQAPDLFSDPWKRFKW
jgi:hypothetical protein